MVRPREFDREEALKKAIDVFWARGFAAASTDDLREAMGIGRQSLYNTFGDKKALYVEALSSYQRRVSAEHLRRLSEPTSPIEGIERLLTGLIAEDARTRQLGCLGVGSVGEFGATDPELLALREKVSAGLGFRITERLKEGQETGEVDRNLDPEKTSAFVQMTMTGLQLAARGGGELEDLRSIARFATERLKPR